MHLPVFEELVNRDEAAQYVDLTKLSAEAGDLLRIIRVGDYDACACIGQHVSNTSEIGKFEILSHNFENGRWRVRFKLL
jgi:Ser-tRNA(Ala) deacylase AlaX